MQSADTFEFVNRTEELKVLRERLLSDNARGSVTILRSPPGFGKTRLTSRIVDDLPIEGPTCIVVDPSIRSKSRSDRIYAWFFVQRAADPAAVQSKAGRPHFRTFGDFLRKGKWFRANWRQLYDTSKGGASVSGLTKIALEMAENFFKFGRYRPEALLNEDGQFACEIAREYIEQLASFRPTLFVIREAQIIDPESLRFFLHIAAKCPNCSVFLEYTSQSNTFSAEHEKIIFESIEPETSLAIFDLVKLSPREFRYLLKKYAPTSAQIEAVAEFDWDGNLRIIRELKYKVMGTQGGSALLHLNDAIESNLNRLSSRQRLLLALVVRHLEAIDIEMLMTVMLRINPMEVRSEIAQDLSVLENEHGYLSRKTNVIAASDEDLASAVKDSPSMQSILQLAGVRLRDYYLDIVNKDAFAAIRLHSAIRQAVALSASTDECLQHPPTCRDRNSRQLS